MSDLTRSDITVEELRGTKPRFLVWYIEQNDPDHSTYFGDEAYAEKEVAQFWADVLNYGRHVYQRNERKKQVDIKERERKEFLALVAAGLREPALPRPPNRWYEEAEAAGRWPQSPYTVTQIEVY